jgi:SPP1 gp7 family putative phage head morphogenesis protein
MADVVPFDLSFDEALAFFRNKGLELSPNGWRDVWGEANKLSFTVAKVAEMDILQEIYDEVESAIEEGMALDEFKSSLQGILEEKGWFTPTGEQATAILPDGEEVEALSGWRLETIYRTNLQSAFSAGRYQQMQEVKDTRPYWEYSAILDDVTRPEHAEMDGLIYEADDSFWDTNYPPNGFNCRCYVKTLSENDMSERDLEVSPSSDLEPDPGFDYNPGQGLDQYEPDLSGYNSELLKEYNRE